MLNINATVPVYAADNSDSNQPVGYLLDNLSGAEKLELWVYTKKEYISSEKRKFVMKIPARSRGVPLYINKPKSQELPEDFVGYLLPGKYFASETPKNSETFKDARWVKIQVRLAK